MGKPHAVRKVHPVGGKQGDPAVTPVIGAILILAISVLGIAGVLYWGAPTLERIQAGNAQSAMVGEFDDLRSATRELSVPDHSRFPTIALPGGELIIQEGTRFMVTATHDPANPTCDFRVTGWDDAAAPASFNLASLGTCRTVVTGTPTAAQGKVELHQVSGSTLTARTVTGTNPYTSSGVNLGSGDWLIRITDGGTPAVVYAEAWILSGDQLRWDLGTSVGDFGLHLDSGALFARRQGTLFLEREPVIGDAAFGTDYYGFWLRTLSAGAYSGITGTGSHQVYLSLLSNAVRVDEAAVTKLRYDVAGDLAEPWCNALLSRNDDLTGASYASTPNAGCAGDADGVRSILFQRSGAAPFAFRFLHADIYATISI